MSATILEIVGNTSGKYLQKKHPERKIKHLLFDSRRVVFPTASLFFALSGKRQDGHDFIKEIYQKGVRSFVISKKIETKKFPEADFILVKNVLEALQKIAEKHRKKFELPTIGITGSNGKTIVKEWLFQLLDPDRRVVRSPKSFNSQIGVPLSVWQIDREDEIGIFEAGISRPDEMKSIAKIIRCDIGIFTNLGLAHNEGFEDDFEKLEEKLKLFKFAKTIIYCEDDSRVSRAIRRKFKHRERISWTSIGIPSCDLKILKQDTLLGKTILEADFRSKKINLEIPFSDEASIENAVNCWLLMLHLGYTQKIIQKRILDLRPQAMRLEMKAAVNNCILLNDSYNNDLTALKIALDFMEQQAGNRARTIILSDILQTGLSSKMLYKSVADLLIEKKISSVIGIGKEIKILRNFSSKKEVFEHYETTDIFLQSIDNQRFSNEAILIKGARPFQFERIAGRLSQKAHKTVLEVNLNALKHNLNVFAERLQPNVKMLVMVKASGYGSGSIEVARLLQFQKIDYLAVAYADEGVELRRAGIQLPILVLNPEEATFDSLFRYDLEPEIYSINQLKSLLTVLPDSQKIKAHLKIDTGMSRLGFSEKDLPTLLKILKAKPQILVQSIFSHLAASEAKKEDAFSKSQFQRFQKSADFLTDALGYRPMRHLLNSAGIVRFPDFQLDMVRLGIGLYGVDGSDEISEQLQTVMTLKATISQIKILKKGDTVGYGRMGKAKKEMKIGTISIGYADGFLRAAGNGNFSVLVKNKFAPTIGNICMDMSMIDLTNIPKTKEGEEVIIFGNNPKVEKLAKCFGTISYEIFTNLSQRVKRVYFEE